MRDLIPYIFWPWFGISCFILLRRRVSGGTWRAIEQSESAAPVEFPPPPLETLPEASALAADPDPAPTPEPGPAPVSPEAPEAPEAASSGARVPGDRDVAVLTPPDPGRVAARTLAEAVEGIAMPCDLAPLMGTGPLNPREVAFVTDGHQPAAVGAALSDEFERLGYAITPLDDRSIRAERGPDVIQARLVSTELTSEEVMGERHPSAPADALVVEMKLT